MITIIIIAFTVLVSWQAFNNRRLEDRLILWPPAISRHRQYDRLLTHGFIHADWQHLIFNMIMLLFIGRQLEAPLGAKAMAVLLVAGAYAGAFAQYLADPASSMPMICRSTSAAKSCSRTASSTASRAPA